MARPRTLGPADYARELVAIGAVEVRTDPSDWFVWSSGRRAPIYCDNRLLLSRPGARARVADGLAAAIQANFASVEVIAGTATAGIPHAAWVAERLSLPMVYVRGAAKGHGQKKRVEGAALSGERVVVVEDLISTAGSALSAVQAIRDEGGQVVGVQAIFSYGLPEADTALRGASVPYGALSDFTALLETLELDASEEKTLLEWRQGG